MKEPQKFHAKSRLKGTYPDPSTGFKGKNLEINNWTISEFIAKELVPVIGVHPFPLVELGLLVAAVSYYKPDFIMEWGTNVGKSARVFHEIKTKFAYHYKVFTIDLPNEIGHPELPKDDEFGYFISGITSIEQLRGDGLSVSLELAKHHGLNKRYLFFLDGDHSYASVKRELNGIFQNVPNACVIVHDTFYQTKESGYNIGPHKAVLSFLKSHRKRKILFQTHYGLPGMTVII